MFLQAVPNSQTACKKKKGFLVNNSDSYLPDSLLFYSANTHQSEGITNSNNVSPPNETS